MADIVVTAARVAPVYPNSPSTLIRAFTTLEAVTAGQGAYGDPTTGKAGVADANAAGKQQFLGIFLHDKGAGESCNVLMKGEIYGFTLAGNYFTQVFLSDTAGALADAAGTMTVGVGKVFPINDPDKTKVLFVDWDPTRVWT